MIVVNSFAGVKPTVPVERLPNEYAASASSCTMDDSELSPLKGNMPIAANLVTGHIKGLYWYARNYWFSFRDDVDAVKSPIAQDDFERVYFTGQDKPQVTANDIAIGVTSPATSFDLGVPAPSEAITITDQTAKDEDVENYADDETRFYVMTYVTGYGEEGAPSPVSSEITLSQADDVVTLALPVPLVNTHNITRKRIYRTASSAGTVDMFFVGEVDIAITELVDNLIESELGYPLQTQDYDLPPENMLGMTSMPGGFLAGFAGNEICFSKAYLPYAWPEGYRGVTEHDVVAIAATDSALVVLTQGYPYLFSGISPDAMSPRKLELRLGCVSKRSVVDMGDAVIYASKQGLVAVSSNGVQVLTKSSLHKNQWQAYEPETIHAYAFERYYIGFYGDSAGFGAGKAGFMYDVERDAFIDLPFYATAGFSDPLEDQLFLTIAGDLFSFAGAESLQDYRWLSKVFIGEFSLACCLLDTDEPEKLGFKLFADGVKVVELAQGQLPVTRFKLPLCVASKWQFELTGSAKVKRVKLANSMGELV